MKKYYGIIMLIIFMACKESTYPSGKEEVVTKDEIARLTNIIEKRGDISVYEYTKLNLERLYQFKELLPISKLMSDKHNYEQATYDVFQTYKNLNGFELSELTRSEQQIALKYLLNAYDNGNQDAKNDLEKYSKKDLFVIKENNKFKLRK
ncbi:hypothetical protein [Lacinutrix mariniflava]|uniref:hypothetical protein n=1 Tax=Lacinutrix mariniflava TaxID=342955 RepID=UPI0006E1FD76|nr:hypothetical protein [Lacinutrix mariniflava]